MLKLPVISIGKHSMPPTSHGPFCSPRSTLINLRILEHFRTTPPSYRSVGDGLNRPSPILQNQPMESRCLLIQQLSCIRLQVGSQLLCTINSSNDELKEEVTHVQCKKHAKILKLVPINAPFFIDWILSHQASLQASYTSLRNTTHGTNSSNVSHCPNHSCPQYPMT